MDEKKVDQSSESPLEQEPPPLLSTWPRLYAAVLGSLILYILLMLIFMKVFT
ncbi:MAG: hypothetical protein WEB37_07615 [Bacteroidota bacterium]